MHYCWYLKHSLISKIDYTTVPEIYFTRKVDLKKLILSEIEKNMAIVIINL